MTWFPLTKLDDWIFTSYPLDHETEFAACLGQVLDYWSVLEHELSLSMMHLVGCDQSTVEVLFYSITSNSARISIIESLAKHLMPNGPEKDGFFDLLARCKNLNKKRNDIVHGQYHSDRPIARVLMKPGSSQIRQYHRYGIEELKAHIVSVNLLTLQFSFANEREPRMAMPQRNTWS